MYDPDTHPPEVSGLLSAATTPAGVDALLLVSFGGPEGPDDVLPFLRNVTKGRDVPDERLAAVAEHYYDFGGRSPINDQNRALLAALRDSLAPLPVYWGNRNWHPLLADTIAQMAAAGVGRAACFVTSAMSSYSGCRQYREDLADAVAAVRAAAGRAEAANGAPELIKLRAFFDHPGFVGPMVDNTLAALTTLPAAAAEATHLVFVAHSVPVSQAAAAGPSGNAYVRQFTATAHTVADQVASAQGRRYPASLAYSSRSGPPSVRWLEPDVGDHLDALAAAGARAVVLVPAGFVSDHMEVVYDLDVEAADRARAAGLAVARAATVGTDPRFVAMVGELLAERTDGAPARALSAEGPSHDVCPLHCCEPRSNRPAAAGTPADLARVPGSRGPLAGVARSGSTGSGDTGSGDAAGTIEARSRVVLSMDRFRLNEGRSE